MNFYDDKAASSFSVSDARPREAMTNIKDESLRFEPVNLDSFAGVDSQTISYQEERLRILGFERAADYCLSSVANQRLQFFTRLCSHPAYNCYVEVYQSLEEGRPRTEVRYSFISLVEEDWRVFSMGHESSPMVSLVCSRPRRAWSSHPNTDIFTVFDAHLKLRQKLTTRRRLSVITLLTLEAFFDEQRRESFAQKEWIKKLNEKGIGAELFGHPKSFWSGDASARGDASAASEYRVQPPA